VPFALSRAKHFNQIVPLQRNRESADFVSPKDMVVDADAHDDAPESKQRGLLQQDISILRPAPI